VIEHGRRAAAAALLTLVAATLAACATHPSPSDSPWLAGRLSIKVAALGTQAARSLSSGFELRGDDEQGELRLTSPLGTLVAEAHWAPGSARLRTSQGETRYSDLDALARDALGEALPLRALPSWLHGRPWPGAANHVNADGFEQLGWHIGMARYDQGLLDVTRSAAPAVTLRAKLERPD